MDQDLTTVYFEVNHQANDVGAAAIRGGSWVLLAQAISTVVRVVASIVLARLLMPADFGLFAIVASVAGGLLIFKDLGLCDAIIQWPCLTDTQVSSLFWVNLGFGIAVAACLVIMSPVLAHIFREPRLAAIMIVWSVTIILGALSAQHLALLKRAMLFAGVSKVSVAAAMISNVGAVTLAWWGAGYWALVLRDVINEVLITAGAWILCDWRPRKPSRQSGIKPILVFGGHSVASFIVRRTTRNLDRTLLGWRFGPVVTGYYHTAFELVAMLASLTAEPLRNVAVSSLARFRNEPERYKQHYLRAVGAVALVAFAVSAVVVVTSRDLVALLLGPKWQRSGELLPIFGLSAGMSTIYMTTAWLHFSLGRADRLARWTILDAVAVGVVVTAGLNFGAKGVAWAYTASTCVLCVAGLRYAARPIGLPLSDIMAVLWRPAAAAAIAGCFGWLVVRATGSMHPPAIRLAFFSATFGPVYVWLLVMLGGGIKAVSRSLDILKPMRLLTRS